MSRRGQEDGRGAEQHFAGAEDRIARARNGEDRADTPDQITRMSG